MSKPRDIEQIKARYDNLTDFLKTENLALSVHTQAVIDGRLKELRWVLGLEDD